MTMFTYRQVNLFAMLLCCIYLGAAFFLQSYQELSPCPLCMLQRWVFVILLFIFLWGGFFARTASQAKIYGILTGTIACLGVFLSGRHLWLLSHPPDVPGVCAPSLTYLLEHQSFPQVISSLFWGSSDCAAMAGSFLNVSIPLWTLMAFISLVIISLWQIIRKPTWRREPL